MKTLLRDGPLDGKVVDTSRNQFGYSEVTQTLQKMPGADKLLAMEEIYYGSSFEYEKHPCKKKGTVRVFRFDPIPHSLRTAIHKLLAPKYHVCADLSDKIDNWLDRTQKSLGKSPRVAVEEGNIAAVWQLLEKRKPGCRSMPPQ